MLKAFLIVLISILSLTPRADSKGLNSCPSLFYQESKQIQGNYVAIPGGIAHGRIHNQKSGEDCWAQAITELVEAHYFAKTGKDVRLSPEYDLFWHVYVQVRSNIRKFTNMREQYQDPNPSARTLKLQKLFKDAYGLGPSRRVNTSLGFQIDVGANADEAISKLHFSGVVPFIRYKQEISTDEREKRIENGLAHFVGNYLLKGDHIERYAKEFDEKDGVNTALFNDLVTSLMQHEHAITQVPLRPNQEFSYQNIRTTPRLFLKDFLQFDPREYQYTKTSTYNQRAALKSIATSIREFGLPALIGMELFGDDAVWMNEQNQGLLSSATCGTNCKEVNGQHELLVVNYLFQDDPLVPTYLIVQNSWGPIGNRDINGNKTRNPKKMGYLLISVEYLNRDEKSGPWDLLITKKVGTLKPAKPNRAN